jgi:trans-2,3-dihydro-3-hydroxyanthranilate isomerase
MENIDIPFYFVDVFADKALAGNSLAVVDAGIDLPIELMQRIAREFNQSETTFLVAPSQPDADWRLRSFTPKGIEVFGAGGHNTIGAWWLLADRGRLGMAEGMSTFRQEIGGQISPVNIWRSEGKVERVVMQQSALAYGKEFSDVHRLARALGLDAIDIATDIASSQVVSTGVPHLLVPIRNSDLVDQISPESSLLLDVLKAAGGEGCYVYSLDARHRSAAAYTRFFNPTIGIAEDPATGTAAGPLGAHLVKLGLVKSGVVTVEQGTALGRTSLIEVSVLDSTVSISGWGVVVASGRLSV